MDRGEMTDVSPGADPASHSVTAVATTSNDLATVRRRVLDTSGRAGLDDDRGSALAVAVNEIVTNAITHGTPPATIALRVTPSALLVSVHDRGTTGFRRPDPGAWSRDAEPPGPDQVNGRGLWLATQLCDRIDLQTGASGTTVTLVVNR